MTFNIYTLGCKVNEYESEVMADLLLKAGYQKAEKPDIWIINTCTVTNTADSKSRKIIRRLKREFPQAIIVAVGCLIQNKIDELSDIGIDIALGNKDKSKIVDYLAAYQTEKITKLYDISAMDFEDMQLTNSDLTRAYIKIQDGCDNYCTYCIIPYVRGHVRAKKHEKILVEAQNLIKNGHQEIVLTGIHTGNYHDGNYDFADLLKDLTNLKGLERLRISSIEITELNTKVLEVFKNSPILVNHLHIPLQAGSDTILKRMNRKYDTTYFINKIHEIRAIRPNVALTTDVIVGFPRETDQLFEETIETIKKIGFAKLHVFPYSKREGTAASKMPNQIASPIKKARAQELLSLSKELEIKYMEKNLDKVITFIPEVYKDGYLIGHTENYLLIKATGDIASLHQVVPIKTLKIIYPYILSEICSLELV